MKHVRIGIIGVGNMGSNHVRCLLDGRIKQAELAAVCDIDPARLELFPGISKSFARSQDLIRSGLVDAVLIATPHYDHTTIGIDALQQGLHVLTEKPISVHKADCQRLISAYQKRPRKKQVFSAMFNQRTDPHYQRIRQIIQAGELGELRRVNWIITDWFRPEIYYASGGWRATWRGEGGGVLLNQCPHNLDLLQWLCGMPKRVQAYCHFGKFHDIEVEDEVTAYLEYPNGATGVFVTTTGEAPGTNRLEIAGTRGKITAEAGQVTFIRNEAPADEFCLTSKALFDAPPTWRCDIPVNGWGGQHAEVLQNFVDAILEGKTLIAPAVEGIHSVELANAMLLSTWKKQTIELPLNAAVYERELKKRISTSRFKKQVVAMHAVDMSASFAK